MCSRRSKSSFRMGRYRVRGRAWGSSAACRARRQWRELRRGAGDLRPHQSGRHPTPGRAASPAAGPPSPPASAAGRSRPAAGAPAAPGAGARPPAPAAAARPPAPAGTAALSPGTRRLVPWSTEAPVPPSPGTPPAATSPRAPPSAASPSPRPSPPPSRWRCKTPAAGIPAAGPRAGACPRPPLQPRERPLRYLEALSGEQAELPVERLVSRLSELSRLRVSYAWSSSSARGPAPWGRWWWRME